MPLVESGYKKGAIEKALKGYPNRNYRLMKAIKKEKEYNSKPYKRDKKIREYLEKNYDKRTNYKQWLIPGQLVMFDYLKPKYMDELEYYDALPMTIFFGVTKAPEGLRVVGFNIHYYPPKIRYQLMDRIFEDYKSIYLKAWDEPLKREVSGFDHNLLIHQLRQAKLDFGIRMYDPQLMKNIRPVPSKGWSKAVFTEGKFMKKSRNAILNYWTQKKEKDASAIARLKKADKAVKNKNK